MLQAIGYVRRSTDRQEESLDQQRAKLESYAKAKGWQLVHVYVDDAISGSDMDRPGLRDFMERATTDRDVEAVVAWDRNRLAPPKDPMDGMALERKIRQAGKRIFYAATGQEANGTFASGLMGYVEHYQNGDYLRKLSRDVARGILSKVRRGRWPGGPIPFGYDRLFVGQDGSPRRIVRLLNDGSQEVIDAQSGQVVDRVAKGLHYKKQQHEECTLIPSEPARVRALQKMFTDFAEGVPTRRIRENLNVAGFRSSFARSFCIPSINAILENPTYTGRCVYNRRTESKWHRLIDGASIERQDEGLEWRPESDWVVVDDAWPALIDKATFDRVQLRRRESRELHQHTTGTAIRGEYLLTSVFVCGVCGSRLTGQTTTSGKGNHTRVRYYVCSAHHRGDKAVCATRYTIPADAVEQHVLGLIAADLQNLRNDDQLHAYLVEEMRRLTGGQVDSLDQLQRRLAELDQQSAKVRDHLMAMDSQTAKSMGLYDQAKQVAEEKADVERRLAENRREVPELPSEAVIRARAEAAFEDFERVVAGGLLEEKRALINAYIQKIEADPRIQTVKISLYSALFSRKIGVIQGLFKQPPRASDLLNTTQTHQNEVGDKLYDFYSDNRLELIRYLHLTEKQPLEEAIRVAQKLLDRIIFMAFCESRKLLPDNLIKRAYYEVNYLARVTNPKWQNFLALFHAVDKGHPEIGVEHGYNGGLFAHDPKVDDLQLPDEPWTNVFRSIADYDFRDEVNATVLGHIFEKSITELERLRIGGLFGTGLPEGNGQPTMQKSAQRKRLGTYYTPPEFTAAIVQFTVDEIIGERFAALRKSHGLTAEDLESGRSKSAHAAYWQECLAALRGIKVVDPACGSGAFLIQAYEALRFQYESVIAELAHLGEPEAHSLANAVPDMILADNLYGVDLAQESVEITQLSLWIASARQGKTLANLSRNIVCGNSLVTDPAVHPDAMNWRERFADVFGRPEDFAGFDCVIGNPPWERLKLQNREFFSLSAPDILETANAAEQRQLIAALETKNPALFQRYTQAMATADATLAHVRASDEFPLTAQGDINTYMLFAELGRKIVAPAGRVGLLVPSGISTDKTTAEFFNALMDGQSLIRLYDFENKKPYFPDVDSRFKFSILNYGGSAVKTPKADFVFFAHDIRDLRPPERHIELSAADMKRMNPNTCTCPVFRTRRDAELTKAIYRRVPVLIDRNRKAGGNVWGIKFMTMFHQSADAALFRDAVWLKREGFRIDGNCWRKGKKAYLPLYEAKMIQAFDHRAAGVVTKTTNYLRQAQPERTTLVDHQNPEFLVTPRFWVEESEVERVVGGVKYNAVIAIKNVTSPTNQRTMIAAFIPYAGVIHSAPLIFAGEKIDFRLQACLLGNLNSIVYDYITRQKIGGVNMSYFIIEQSPTLSPDLYGERCPWNKKQTLETWISERVLKLTCTAHDMGPLAKACGFAGPTYWHKWKPSEREALRAELDAAYFHLYGITRDDAAYILGTFAGTRADSSDAMLADAADDSDESAGTDLAYAGKLILQAYDALA